MRCILLFAIILLNACTLDKPRPEFLYPVGYIDPRDAVADRDFNTCYEELTWQYYNLDPEAGYKYGKRALQDSVYAAFQSVSKDSGFVVIRFIVNCNGEAGRFQVFECDTQYKLTSFHPDVSRQLLAITRNLKEWSPIAWEKEPLDSYLYLLFKLEDGAITEILP